MTVKDLLNVLDVHNARTISIIWNDKIVWEGEDITDIPQTLLGCEVGRVLPQAEADYDDGFELVEDVDKKSVLLKVYEKGVGSKHFSKHFTVSILYNYSLFVVKTEVDINGVEFENEVQFTLDVYPSVEDKIKNTIKVISDLSNGYF